MDEYITRADQQRQRRNEKRKRALEKLANGGPVVCAICGCPHSEILHIGHPEHRGGRFHRRELSKSKRNSGNRETILWILKTPMEEVIKRVQLECPYCNSWHNRFKEYPPENKRPYWVK